MPLQCILGKKNNIQYQLIKLHLWYKRQSCFRELLHKRTLVERANLAFKERFHKASITLHVPNVGLGAEGSTGCVRLLEHS